MDIESQIEQIQERNHRVEADKAWETSWSRILIITLITYLIAFWFMWRIEVPRSYFNALVPTGGYFLSTLTIPFLKRWWIKRYQEKL